MVPFASHGMQWDASANAVTKGAGSEGGVRGGRLMLMTECGPRFHPLSVPNKEEWERGEWRSGGTEEKEEQAFWGSKPLPAR